MPRFSIYIAVAVVTLLAVATIVPMAVVGQDNETNDRPTLEIDTDADTSAETYAEEIDSNIRLMEWDYNDDRDGFELVFEADQSTRITLTEAIQFGEGTGSGRIYSHRLPPGVTEVFIPVPRRGGEAAVTMTTAESIRENRFSYVSTGEAEPDRPPIDYERVQFLVGGTAILSGVLTLTWVRRKRDEETKEAERIL